MSFPIYEVGDRVILRSDLHRNGEYTNEGIRSPGDIGAPYLMPSRDSLSFAGEELTISFVDETDDLVYYTCEETGGGSDVSSGVWYVAGMFTGPANPMVEISSDTLDEILVL